MDPTDVHIVSLSYDVHNKKVFGIIDRSAGALSTSINFNFPYASSGHASDDELQQDMEREVRCLLTTAAQFRRAVRRTMSCRSPSTSSST